MSPCCSCLIPSQPTIFTTCTAGFIDGKESGVQSSVFHLSRVPGQASGLACHSDAHTPPATTTPLPTTELLLPLLPCLHPSLPDPQYTSCFTLLFQRCPDLLYALLFCVCMCGENVRTCSLVYFLGLFGKCNDIQDKLRQQLTKLGNYV